MRVDLPPDAERFLLSLAQLPTHEWVRAARAYAGARRALMFAEARTSLAAALEAARGDPADAAVAAEIIHRIQDAVRAVRPAVGNLAALSVVAVARAASAVNGPCSPMSTRRVVSVSSVAPGVVAWALAALRIGTSGSCDRSAASPG